MSKMKDHSSVATVLGDVVGSRSSADRGRLHTILAAALAAINDELDPPGPLRVTVGDEYQGSFPDLGTALRAAWRLQWALAGEAELRHGVGWGPVAVLSGEPRVEDGPGWWAAREAIESVKADATRPATRHLRTAYRLAERSGGPAPGAVNAALLCRDQMVGSLSERSRRILGGLVAGRTQAEIAEAEGISPSAVSQRVRGDGLAVVTAAQELLEGDR
jgi:hypothetical protein